MPVSCTNCYKNIYTPTRHKHTHAHRLSLCRSIKCARYIIATVIVCNNEQFGIYDYSNVFRFHSVCWASQTRCDGVAVSSRTSMSNEKLHRPN